MVLLKYTCPIYKRSLYSAFCYKGKKYLQLFCNVTQDNIAAMLEHNNVKPCKNIVIIQVKNKSDLIITEG